MRMEILIIVAGILLGCAGRWLFPLEKTSDAQADDSGRGTQVSTPQPDSTGDATS